MIDILFFIAMSFAFYKGFTRGFIIAIFSVLGFIVGLAAALKLSATVAQKLSTISDATKWLPMLSFGLVFIATVFAVNFLGKLLQKTFETLMLGWANKIAGILLYAFLYAMIFSVFLFYAVQLHFFNDNAISTSSVYPFIGNLGPKVMNIFGVIIPWFKDMFEALTQFFGKIASNTP
jgi:membrane protein required for colicin V production